MKIELDCFVWLLLWGRRWFAQIWSCESGLWNGKRRASLLLMPRLLRILEKYFAYSGAPCLVVRLGVMHSFTNVLLKR